MQEAQAQLQAANAKLTYAKTEFARYTALLKRDATSQVDVDHWNFEWQSAEAAILSAQAQLAIAQLNLEHDRVRLTRPCSATYCFQSMIHAF